MEINGAMNEPKRLSKEREQEIREEFKIINAWFCSDWIKNIASDLLAELDRVRRELSWYESGTIHTCHSECQKPICIVSRERDQLREKLRVAVDALKFYGNEDHWSNKQSVMESHGSLPKIANKVVNKDLSLPRGGEGYWFKVAGKKAREALAKIGDVG